MNKNQNGFATLEIILIIGITGIFATVAVPNMQRIIDKVALNYEMKHLYSELSLARSIGKSSNFHGGIFSSFECSGKDVEFWIYSGKFQDPPSSRNTYQIRRDSKAHYLHKLNNGITLTLDMTGEYNTPLKINCHEFSVSRTLTLTSKYGNKGYGYVAYIYLDTVGRISGDYVERYP